MVTRIISAALAIVVAIVILILSDTIVLNIAIALLSAGIIYELLNAKKLLKNYVFTLISIAFVAYVPFTFFEGIGKYKYLVEVILILLLFTTYVFNHKAMKFEDLLFIIASVILTSVSMNSLLIINNFKDFGLFLLIITLASAWISDSGAYFTGTFLGKHKLCPEISPKKTIEGAIGGVVTTGLVLVLVAFLYSKYLNSKSIEVEINYLVLALLGIICSILGMVGDLSASLLKRQCDIKDYGNIMPGHGGVLDRFDSVLFIAPFMASVFSVFTIIKYI